MKNLKKSFNSVQVKLFLTLCVVIVLIIAFLIIINNVILETFFLYNKKETLKSVYEQINAYYRGSYSQAQIDQAINKFIIDNNFEVLIKNGENVIYSSDKYLISNFAQMAKSASMYTHKDKGIIELHDRMIIRTINDNTNNSNYLFLAAELDNTYALYIRIPIAFIHESVEISNRFLYTMAIFVIAISAIIVSFVSKRFTKPIVELNDIAKKMSNLDFGSKYQETEADDEINDLGRSINVMSDKLEKTINRLRSSNLELERDIEEKSKIDEMRKSFISDVSHELKTPIALIQGYSEGLLENVNKDEESRKFYAEVISDEASKMDKLVKQLLELMNLEYGKRDFDNKPFCIVELEREVLKRSTVMIEEQGIKVEFDDTQKIEVYADDFYIEQVITNYITNAIKHVQEVNGRKVIKIANIVKNDIVRVTVFNTGKNIKDEEAGRIWNRFYKGDVSRNREDRKHRNWSFCS